MLGKFLAFFATFAGLAGNIHADYLADSVSVALQGTSYLPYALMALPFCAISYGFHGSIPSLVKLYGNNHIRKIVVAICAGMAFSVFLYIFWLAVTMGNIPRRDFPAIIVQGGNINVFVGALKGSSHSPLLKITLVFFGNFAISASLIAATLGLFDYITDLFSLKNNRRGRLAAAVLTYLPPAFLCFFFPDGFVCAIGYAGLAFSVWSILLPPLLVKRARTVFTPGAYRAPCNTLMLNVVFLAGMAIVIATLLSFIGVLPVFR